MSFSGCFFLSGLIFGLLTVDTAVGECTNPVGCVLAVLNPLQFAKHVKFFLYTREHGDLPQELSLYNHSSIRNADFVPKAPIKVLIHGFTGGKDYSPNMEIRPAYLKHYNYNIISLDYGCLAVDGCYIYAAANTIFVSKVATKMIHALLKRPDIKLSQFHLIGFSLGAQLAGQIGGYFTEEKIERITGLDPAFPLFYDNMPPLGLKANHLDAGDAKFVDVYHTNCGIKGKFGPSGHVDFYANAGTFQPGCGRNSSCSHVRAVEYFAESIAGGDAFVSEKCEGGILAYLFNRCISGPEPVINAGENVPNSARGDYFFFTHESAPYADAKDEVPKNVNLEEYQNFYEDQV